MVARQDETWPDRMQMVDIPLLIIGASNPALSEKEREDLISDLSNQLSKQSGPSASAKKGSGQQSYDFLVIKKLGTFFSVELYEGR